MCLAGGTGRGRRDGFFIYVSDGGHRVRAGHSLHTSDGSLIVGVGPGSGYAFVLVVAGLLAASVALIGSSIRVIREVEDLLPDHAIAAAEH